MEDYTGRITYRLTKESEDRGEYLTNVRLFREGNPSARMGMLDALSKQELRRIIACVNACAGMATEELENGMG